MKTLKKEFKPFDSEERKMFNYLVNILHRSIEEAHDYIIERRQFNATH